MDLREIAWEGGVEWIHLAQDRDRWRAVVNAVMNLRVLAKPELVSYGTECIYSKLNKVKKKEILCLLRTVVDCSYNYIVHYLFKFFKVTSTCSDIFSDSCDRATCNLTKH
jgi:hypothetical protein